MLLGASRAFACVFIIVSGGAQLKKKKRKKLLLVFFFFIRIKLNSLGPGSRSEKLLFPAKSTTGRNR